MEGWKGWDEYAPFYDWENARTMGRQDVKFWQELARREGGPVLELGCGTGRVTIPVARTGVPIVGVDRSPAMLAYNRLRSRRLLKAHRPGLVLGDIRALPFPNGAFTVVMAPYGILQSLTKERDLKETLLEVARVLPRHGTFGIDLVPDVPAWDEYKRRVRFRGKLRRDGSHVTLIESVRQDRRRRLTTFDQEYNERRGSQRRRRTFSLTFRTLPLPQMVARVEQAGFVVTAVLGDYRGRAWDLRADVWLLLAARR
ncbi:MAG TPA: class I SAM-dependent methyltransferase [Vicinamibacterales bacterium]|jgi:ubiquinone/menaquinone biosynthesis C-methylase UbiE